MLGKYCFFVFGLFTKKSRTNWMFTNTYILISLPILNRYGTLGAHALNEASHVRGLPFITSFCLISTHTVKPKSDSNTTCREAL